MVTHPDGAVTRFAYDNAGNRQSVTRKNAAGNTFSTTTYTYDALNRLTNQVNTNGSGALVSSYVYDLRADGKRRMVTESGPSTSGSTTTYTYDDSGKLTQESGAYGTVAYGYDNVGNRRTRTVSGSTTAALVNGQTVSTYDANDRITSQSGPAGSVAHTYDADGNETTVNGQVASYDFENHLIGLSGGTSYTYDADGNRVGVTTSGVTTSYLVDTSLPYASVVEEYSGSTLAARYDYGDDLVRMDRGSGVYYYLYDGLGSTRQLVNTGGSVTDGYYYDAFGTGLSRTGSTVNPFLFNAQQFDAASGDYYLRARYYDPSNGRFLSQDPFGGSNEDPISLHRYLYANSDPEDNRDPSGNETLADVVVSLGVQAISYKTQITAGTIGAQILFSFLYPDLAQDIALSMQALPGVGAEEAATANAGRTARQAASKLDNYATRLTEDLLGDEFEGLNAQVPLFRALALKVRGINSQIANRNNVALADFVINGEHGGLIGISGGDIKTFGPQFQSYIANLVKNIPNFNFSELRQFDSERKILEQLAERLKGQTDAVGDLVLYSERNPCESCSPLINEFKLKFPRVNIHVISSNLTTDDIKAGL